LQDGGFNLLSDASPERFQSSDCGCMVHGMDALRLVFEKVICGWAGELVPQIADA